MSLEAGFNVSGLFRSTYIEKQQTYVLSLSKVRQFMTVALELNNLYRCAFLVNSCVFYKTTNQPRWLKHEF